MSTPTGTNRPTKATSSPPHLDISRISGNASEEIKRTLGDIPAIFATYIKCGRYTGFGKAIKERMMVTELSIIPKAEEPLKLEGRAVIEIDVMEDMVNAEDNIHGGCLAFLIDVSSLFALAALFLHEKREVTPSMSQSINVVFHSPAARGDRIRLVNTSLAVGKRTRSAHTEIWNVTHHRMVASGVHIMMSGSSPKPKL